ncbi:high frequency lysogenization protein HflD [Buchnera aphidicola]|uniref:high frequency lysogenization protein HflD n=1 Tax=Buchnera aphidicola TaxID=9 RepID=UPI0021CA1475|nr:high frequency lysogenization protein HflD [Buchnera aphidicola]
MIKKMYSITLSLAGICQSVHLVQQLAQSGKCDRDAFKVSLQSILEINPDSVIKIYGNHEKNLNVGLKKLVSILTFSNFSFSYIELIKYIFDMMIVERKLKKDHMATCSLKKKILIVSSEYYINNNIHILTSQLAKIYLDIISSLGSRILVKGVKVFLQDFTIQEKIRCLLLSGIRSIVLWKQFGGNQIKLIYFRYYIIRKAKKILFNLKN